MKNKIFAFLSLIFCAFLFVLSYSQLSNADSYFSTNWYGPSTATIGASGTLDIDGALDYDGTGADFAGTLNADTVDIDGAVNMATTLVVTGVVTLSDFILLDGVTADPCDGATTEGALFWDTTGNKVCYCDGTNDLELADGSTCY